MYVPTGDPCEWRPLCLRNALHMLHVAHLCGAPACSCTVVCEQELRHNLVRTASVTAGMVFVAVVVRPVKLELCLPISNLPSEDTSEWASDRMPTLRITP
eukprot:521347-Alexandrium_andersonii.AAC.1